MGAKTRNNPLLANANPGCPQAHLAMVTRATIDVEGTGFSGGPVGVKRISVRLLIVLVARKLTTRTHAVDAPAGLDAFAARGTVGIECARYGLGTEKHTSQSNAIFRANFLHGIQFLQIARSMVGRTSSSWPGCSFLARPQGPKHPRPHADYAGCGVDRPV